MKLNLSVESRILASVPVEAAKAHNEYYLKAFRRLLTIRHHKKLVLLNKEPFFFLDYGAEKNRRHMLKG
jgi:hypothetical protein